MARKPRAVEPDRTNYVGTIDGGAESHVGSDGIDSGTGGIETESAEPDQYRANPEPADSGKRKPGRPPGSGKTATERKGLSAIDKADAVTAALYGTHQLAAWLSSIDEVEISEEQAEKLAKALLTLQKFYPSVDVPAVYLAWLNLASVAIKVYAPNVAAYKLRKSNEAHERKRKGPQAVPAAPTHAAL